MADEANNNAVTVEDDLNTTAPHSKPDVWSMPDPVFQKTSGKLPQGFEKNYVPASYENSTPPDASSSPTPAPEDPAPQSPTLKLMLVILGLVGMVAFLVVFLSVVYFFFMRSNGTE